MIKLVEFTDLGVIEVEMGSCEYCFYTDEVEYGYYEFENSVGVKKTINFHTIENWGHDLHQVNIVDNPILFGEWLLKNDFPDEYIESKYKLEDIIDLYIADVKVRGERRC
jgi:hypothetical protein